VKSILIVYTATLIALLVVDLAYLATLGIKLFKNQLGPGVLREKPAISAAILFYLIYVAGVVFFAVLPNSSTGVAAVALNGALFGFVGYATYDLTNMATLTRWTWLLVVLDMAWGSLVTAGAAAAGWYVAAVLQ
jgi:uncharacterized membrane protein